MRRANTCGALYCFLLSGLIVLAAAGYSWGAGNVSESIQDVGGRVGIGTLTPQDSLEVVGRIRMSQGGNASEFFTGSSGGLNGLHLGSLTNIPVGLFTNSSGPQFLLTPAGDIGLGVLVPAAKFDVDGRIRMRQGGNAGEFFAGSSGGLIALHLGSLTNVPLAFYTNSSAPLMVLDTSGRLGLGTSSPTAKLHVAGDAKVDGNIAAKYQDVAEWVPTRAGALAAGTVVIIDPQARNRVLPAAQPYDSRVAGVVSARPGVILGEEGSDRVKVAHAGRVPVKVDASFGAIQIGDLLVTSPTPGHAMRSTPVDLGGIPIHRPGTVVGKALEPLTEGQGEILVLLTLQ